MKSMDTGLKKMQSEILCEASQHLRCMNSWHELLCDSPEFTNSHSTSICIILSLKNTHLFPYKKAQGSYKRQVQLSAANQFQKVDQTKLIQSPWSKQIHSEYKESKYENIQNLSSYTMVSTLPSLVSKVLRTTIWMHKIQHIHVHRMHQVFTSKQQMHVVESLSLWQQRFIPVGRTRSLVETSSYLIGKNEVQVRIVDRTEHGINIWEICKLIDQSNLQIFTCW